MSDLFGSDVGEGANQGDGMSRASSPLSSIGPDADLGNSIQTPPQSQSNPHDAEDSNSMVAEGGDDLFGSDSEENKTAPTDYSEEDEEVEKIQVRVLDVIVPALPVPRSDNNRYILARTPNILQLNPTPFTEDTYEDLIAEENEIAAKHGVSSAVTPELSAAVEGIISNTVRWRRKRLADGTIKRESNARLVKWSDGTTSVIIGSGHVPENYSISSEALADPTKKEQHYHAVVHHPRMLMMQSHARLTEQWLLRPSRQSAQARSSVSLLLDRVKSRADGGESAILGESAGKHESKAKSSRTRFMVVNENPELISKRAEEEEERRERQRKKEERMRERMEARNFQQQLQQQQQDGYGGEYSDNEEHAGDHGYGLEEQGGYDYERTTASSVRRNYPPGSGRNVSDARRLPPRSNYIEDDLDGFIDDDDPEVGPRDEFDIEEEEEEELAAAARLKDAKRYQGDHEEEANRVRGSKSRRVMDSDEEED